MTDKNKINELIDKFITITLILYLISFFLVLIFRTIFAFANGEEPVGSFMLNFRSFLLGSLNEEENLFSTRFTSIGLYAIHFTLLFAFFIYKSFLANSKSGIIVPIIMIIIGLLLTITMYQNFFFCLPEAIAFAGIIALVFNFLPYELTEKSEKPIIMVYKTTIIVISVVALFAAVLPYIGE